jgi:hypothetical protein
MLTRYVRHQTDNKSSAAQSMTAKGWLHYILEKSTPRLLCKGSDDAADGKQRERRFAFCVRWIGQRNRGAIFPGTIRAKTGDPMVSFWWVLVAFIGGGCAGILVMSLMQMAGGLPEQSAQAPDLNGMPW